jgi:ActR/RegA family two-component response regulator
MRKQSPCRPSAHTKARADQNPSKRTQFSSLWADVLIVAKDHLGNAEATGKISTGRDAACAARATARSRSSILIVDDDGELARRYQRALESYGYAVERAAHGEGAIRLAGEKQFDVVVGDVDPREECAGSTLRRIHDQRKEVPVVLLSNVLAFASARVAAECGAYRYLVKPVSDDQLLEALVETIQESLRRPD